MPVSTTFDDPYYSRADGLAETQHVFLNGNGLAGRFPTSNGFRIAELGFGTGLNFLASLDLWRRVAPDGAVLHYTSFEMYPMSADEIASALKPWDQLRDAAADLVAAWPKVEIRVPGAILNVVVGDARAQVPGWAGRADAWFLDGFAPARNPEMWGVDLLQAVFDHTAPGGTAATYSAAGAVRRGLATAGFSVSKAPGYGRKRDMTIAHRPITGSGR